MKDQEAQLLIGDVELRAELHLVAAEHVAGIQLVHADGHHAGIVHGASVPARSVFVDLEVHCAVQLHVLARSQGGIEVAADGMGQLLMANINILRCSLHWWQSQLLVDAFQPWQLDGLEEGIQTKPCDGDANLLVGGSAFKVEQDGDVLLRLGAQ